MFRRSYFAPRIRPDVWEERFQKFVCSLPLSTRRYLSGEILHTSVCRLGTCFVAVIADDSRSPLPQAWYGNPTPIRRQKIFAVFHSISSAIVCPCLWQADKLFLLGETFHCERYTPPGGIQYTEIEGLNRPPQHQEMVGKFLLTLRTYTGELEIGPTLHKVIFNPRCIRDGITYVLADNIGHNIRPSHLGAAPPRVMPSVRGSKHGCFVSLVSFFSVDLGSIPRQSDCAAKWNEHFPCTSALPPLMTQTCASDCRLVFPVMLRRPTWGWFENGTAHSRRYVNSRARLFLACSPAMCVQDGVANTGPN